MKNMYMTIFAVGTGVTLGFGGAVCYYTSINEKWYLIGTTLVLWGFLFFQIFLNRFLVRTLYMIIAVMDSEGILDKYTKENQDFE